MKKLILFIYILVLIMIFLGTSTYSASLSLNSSKSEINVGDTVSVTVSFGAKVAAADVTMSFDSSKFKYTGVSTGTANLSGSSVKVSYFDSTGGSNPISSITFKFKSIATGSGSFSAKCTSAADSNVNSLTVSGSPSKSIIVKEKEKEQKTTEKKENTSKPTPTPTPKKKSEVKQEEIKQEEKIKSSNANLAELNIESFPLNADFNKDITKYYISVNQDVNTINVLAKTEDENSKYEVSGNTDLQFGVNTVTIKVTAEDDTIKEYIVEVNKADTTIGLSSLLVSKENENLTFSPDFDKNTLLYMLNVENASKLDIEASANHEDAQITITR